MENKKEEDSSVTRRSFLGWMIAGLASLMAAVLGGSGTAYFVSPIFKKKSEDWVDVGSVLEFKTTTPTKVEFVQRKRDAWVTTEHRSSAWILTSNRQDFVAFDPKCTHLGCPYRWDQERQKFLCPCHTAVFGVDGEVVSGPPPRPLDRYAVKVVGGRLYILPTPVTAARPA